jgi:hypothetical protein
LHRVFLGLVVLVLLVPLAVLELLVRLALPVERVPLEQPVPLELLALLALQAYCQKLLLPRQSSA